MNLLNMATAKKVKTFFNKLVSQARRSKTDFKVKVLENQVIHSMDFDDLRISVVANFDSISNFKEMSMNFEKWFNAIGSIGKNTDEIQYLPIQTGKTMLTMDTNALDAVIVSQPEANYIWENICNVYSSMALINAINITSSVTGNGKLPVNTKVFFQIKDNEMKVLNTNDVILHQNLISDVEGNEMIFAIDNNYISKLKQFLAYNNGINEVSISVCENMMMFYYYKANEFEVQLICPYESTDSTIKTFQALERIMNTKYFGRLVTLNEKDMFQSGVESQIAWLFQNKKSTTKLNPQMLKKELDKFTANPDKLDAYKKMDKAIELPYLSVAKSVGVDNLYINRIMYQNYVNMIQDLPYSIYFLSTKAEALMFGSNDEELRFKTLFMLRKPADPIVELTDEDLEVMENTKAEISLSEEDDDTFVPT